MKTTRRILAAAAIASLGLAAGCEDLIVGGTDDVTGLTIEDASGATLATVSGSGVSGTVTVPRGGSRALVITLRGPSGVVTPSLSETVRVTVTNPGVATWQDGGSGTGTLRGEAAGSTTMRVDLLRSGSSVFASPSIPVVVTP